VSVASPGTPRTLTFAEIQTLIEQGRTDEIPNNKRILDTLNVGLGSVYLRLYLTDVATGRSIPPVSRALLSGKSPGKSQ
jgi:hypothetical protein